MATRPTLGWNNRLVQRVMRHRNITTLFPTAPTGTARSAGTVLGSMPDGAGYIAVVIDPTLDSELTGAVLANTAPVSSESTRARPTRAVAVAPENQLTRNNTAAAPTRARPNEPARVAPAPGTGRLISVSQGPLAVPRTGSSEAPAMAVPPSTVAATSRLTTPESSHQDQALPRQTQPPPVPESPPPTTDDRGDTALTDQVWRRLQTIFQRHQGRSSSEAAASPAEVPAATPMTGRSENATGTTTGTSAPSPAGTPRGPVQRATADSVATQAVRMAPGAAVARTRTVPHSDTAAPQGSPARLGQPPRIVEVTPAPEAPAASTAAGPLTEIDSATLSPTRTSASQPPAAPDGGTDSSTLDVAPRRSGTSSARSADGAETPAQAGTELLALPEVAEPIRIAPNTSAEPTGSVEPAGDVASGTLLSEPALLVAPASRSPEPPQPSQPAPLQDRPGGPSEIRSPAPEVVEQGVTAPLGDRPQNTRPLQDVWAVQRLPESAGPSSGPATPATAAPDRQPNQIASEPIATGVAEVLDRVAAGRLTQSSIELISPRRPRPGRTQAEVAGPVTAQPAAASEVQRPAHGAEVSADARGVPEILLAPTPAAVIAPSPSASGEHTAPRQRLIETEIGALPSDLWELIGETPPMPQIEPRSIPITPAPTAEPGRVSSAQIQPRPSTPTTLQRSVISTTAQAPTHATETQQAGPAQSRAQQAPVSGTSPTAAGEPAAEAEASAAAAPEVDIDKLAHRVYGEIKRRLTVEWERIRH